MTITIRELDTVNPLADGKINLWHIRRESPDGEWVVSGATTERVAENLADVVRDAVLGRTVWERQDDGSYAPTENPAR